MNTQNVNVKTAAAESTETGGERPKKVFFSPTLHIGWHAERIGAKWQTVKDGKTLAEMRHTWPDLKLVTLEEYNQFSAAHFCTLVKEIDEQRFTCQLEEQLLEDWQYPGKGQGQSFKLSEDGNGDITDIFVNVQGRFFKLRDSRRLTHQELVTRIQREVFDKENA